MDDVSIQLSTLDIKVRDYLNVKKYHKIPRYINHELELIKKNIPYFWMNASTLVTGYIIKTIDGDILKPIIGIRNLSMQRQLHNDFHICYNAFVERRRLKWLFNAVSCLTIKTKLPIDVIIYIFKWTDLISLHNIDE
jgi:hypothetical protein